MIQLFTGIIENTGEVIELNHTAGGLRLGVDVSGLSGAMHEGDSVSVDGVCLTVVEPRAQRCDFDVIAETIRRTRFAELKVGQSVNLERSMGPSSRFDGHFVQGHVDALAILDHTDSSSQEWVSWFCHEPDITPLVVPKGSITINGVSLTIAETKDQRFSVALIPTTLQRTNLSQLDIGDRVNIETDILVRAVLHQLNTTIADRGQDGFMSQLRRQGFA